MGRLQVTAEPGQLSIIMQFALNAPAEKVFRAYTDADMIKKWWGGRTYETKVDTYEAHNGGSWRLVQVSDDGEFGFHGVFHEVSEAEKRISWTFEFEGMPGHVAFETTYFTEKAGKTEVRIVSVFQSQEDRDGMIASGMEKGASEGIDVLAELVEDK